MNLSHVQEALLIKISLESFIVKKSKSLMINSYFIPEEEHN